MTFLRIFVVNTKSSNCFLKPSSMFLLSFVPSHRVMAIPKMFTFGLRNFLIWLMKSKIIFNPLNGKTSATKGIIT
ncbi:Uncharacterised protein [Segatella copri]|nr:Uncharacterised protein [Segatella copri]